MNAWSRPDGSVPIAGLILLVLAWPALETRGDGDGGGAVEPAKPEPALIDPASPEGYRAEFRYLREAYHKIDLAAAPVKTDGWTYNIAEAEWPFLGLCYFGFACVNLAEQDPTIREEALEETRWIIEALQKPAVTGFMTTHFGAPFGEKEIHASCFVHGHFLQVALRYREVSGDRRYDKLIRQVGRALERAYAKQASGLLPSYRKMWWLTDNFVCAAALVRVDRVFGTDRADWLVRRVIRKTRRYYLDEQTGLFATYVDPAKQRIIQGPRGISGMYGFHHLKDIDPEFAAAQYKLARQHFVRRVGPVAAVREYPEGVDGKRDIDSDRIVLGLGPSASGFAIAAAAIMEDRETAAAIMLSATLVGGAVQEGDQIRYASMPRVGQTVILFGKTEVLRLSASTEGEKPPAEGTLE